VKSGGQGPGGERATGMPQGESFFDMKSNGLMTNRAFFSDRARTDA